MPACDAIDLSIPVDQFDHQGQVVVGTHLTRHRSPSRRRCSACHRLFDHAAFLQIPGRIDDRKPLRQQNEMDRIHGGDSPILHPP